MAPRIASGRLAGLVGISLRAAAWAVAAADLERLPAAFLPIAADAVLDDGAPGAPVCHSRRAILVGGRRDARQSLDAGPGFHLARAADLACAVCGVSGEFHPQRSISGNAVCRHGSAAFLMADANSNRQCYGRHSLVGQRVTD